MKKDIIYRLFEITGNEKDALIFLKNFKSIEPEKFALIHIDINTFYEYGESIVYDLKILQRLGLFPVILISETTFDYLQVFYDNLFEWNSNHEEHLLHANKYSLEGLELKRISYSIEHKRIPIIIHKDNINHFEPVKECYEILKSNKIIYLKMDLPFWEISENKVLSLINLKKDYDKLIHFYENSPIEQEILKETKLLFEVYPEFLKSISITSPITLFKELFTIKGSGTYIKPGSDIKFIHDFSKVSEDRLKKLLETSFRKKIKEEFLTHSFDSIILESNYRGAAIMKKTPHGYLLSKFSVDEIARGEGIGREIWDKMKEKFDTIIWRANPSNPINKWYQVECDGQFKFSNWNIYWIGLDVSLVPEVCKYLNDLDVDFYE